MSDGASPCGGAPVVSAPVIAQDGFVRAPVVPVLAGRERPGYAVAMTRDIASRTAVPQGQDPMAGVRADIDGIDRALVALLRRRADCIDRAIAIKTATGLPARLDTRVEEVVDNVRATAVAEGLDAALVEALWRHLIDWSIDREAAVLGKGDDR